MLLNKKGITKNWKENLIEKGVEYSHESIFNYAKEHHLENLIAVDNTASKPFVESYVSMIENGFDIVSSNKIANTLSFDFYQQLRNELQKNQKQYLLD